MLKFVNADGSSIGQKRRQSQRACDGCRAKKKRCSHVFNSEDSAGNGGSQSDAAFDHGDTIPANSGNRVEADVQRFLPCLQGEIDHDRNRGAHVSPRHGSLDRRAPASIVENDVPPPIRNRRSADGVDARFIGDMNPEGILLAAADPGTIRSAASNDSIGIWLAEKFGRTAAKVNPNERSQPSLFYGFSPMVRDILWPMLQGECLSLLPPRAELDALISFYFEKIHPMFSVIDRGRFEGMQSTDPTRVLLQQGMCLVASMNFSMQHHLKLSGGDAHVSHREFGKRLHAAMRTSIEIGLVKDKIVLIQCLALMSFFMDEPDGRDVSALMCGRAVHYLHSLGLHIQDGQASSEDDYIITLLCSIWALDRFHAAFHGRPVMMHERDLGRDLASCIDRQKPCFRLFLQVAVLLDKVIDMYRPKRDQNNPPWDGEFLPFDDLITRSEAQHVSTPFLATIETFYHSVAVLSCRDSFENSQRSSASYLRQTVSASRITDMIRREFQGKLILLPFVPYAASLSLSVSYREMRRNKIPIYRKRARDHFQTNCNILEELGEIFWLASVMADMSRATLDELDRVASTVAQSQRRKSRQQDGAHQSADNTSADLSDSSALPVDQGSAPTSSSNTTTTEGNLGAEYTPTQNSEYSIFDDTPGLDVFEMFDPSFDLDGFDAFLEGNLDLSFPTNLQ